MKKTIAIVLAAMMLIVCFAGCSSAPAESTPPVTDNTAPVTDSGTQQGGDSGTQQGGGSGAGTGTEDDGIEGMWVNETDDAFTMEVTADTITMADGTQAGYTFDGEKLIISAADGDIEGVYDPEADTLTVSAGGVSTVYARASEGERRSMPMT